MKYSREEKIKIYETLPQELKEAIISVELSEKLQNISSKNSLMLDQTAELSDEVNLFMIGLTKQEDFVKNISTRLGVNMATAENISRDINTEIFDSIRSSLQEIQNRDENSTIEPPPNLPTSPDFSTLEQAGQFEVEKPTVQTIQYNNPTNKADVLKSIEDKQEPTESIPMVDHLLSTPVITPEEIVVKKTPVVEKKAPYSTDPYREQL